MFTGLIRAVGRIERVATGRQATTFTIATSLDTGDIALGDSLAVNGACLTVVAIHTGSVAVTAVAETLERTTLGALRVGEPANLERPLRLGDRLDGHLVQGHVDGVGRLEDRRREGDSMRLSFSHPAELGPYLVEKGSVAVDGISLTVAGLGQGTFDIAVIPHTLENTTLGRCPKGARVNLEMDIIGKYVAKMLQKRGQGMGGLTLETLAEHGFV